ncbi:uncharacterized protein MONBRDRAFT_29871 [Monosiga brevicollis MX1]|uniref:mitogen-activated protein kinase kinase n=1 Tax=Monosiga brevicollis TaxID=81824 RepID=A9VCD2_MONBE|nr:uncharacterized protein MONBRDRAFT_29871 [Monosiga brevicollis MX1]EDQ84880.1 predicted protein [Monosiga brevicollis MX1]|eukprot:XP_001750381.1 hypothetical protein [Monosiga brevicollis MX1]
MARSFKGRLKSASLRIDTTKAAEGTMQSLNELLAKRGRLGVCTIQGQDYSCTPEAFEPMHCWEHCGSGEYGSVYKALHRASGAVCAIKIVSEKNTEPKSREHLLNDLDVIRTANHDHIVKFYGFDFQDNAMRIIMEHARCDWNTLVGQAALLTPQDTAAPEGVVRLFALSVVRALVYLADNLNTFHRDVKPANVLLAHDGSVKLCDFGICKRVAPEQVLRATTKVGCYAYLPPERLLNQVANYDSRTDVWALGVTCLQLGTLARCPIPLRDDFRLLQLMNNIKSGGLYFAPQLSYI